MIYIKNFLVLLFIKILNKFGRGHYLKKRVLSSYNILNNNFTENASFNFIQVGANDGVSFDFLYDFVIKRDSSGIVVEPVKEYFDELVINYANFPKIKKINYAVHPSEKEVAVYKILAEHKNEYPDWVKGIASLDPFHHKKTNIKTEHIGIEYVKSETLMNIINHYYLGLHVDYFQIDTEGFDFEIIKMLDFNIIKPLVIKYESVNLSDECKNNLIKILNKKGYFLFNEGGDTISINLWKLNLI